MFFFFFSSRRRHTRLTCDWSSDVCSSDLDRGFQHSVAEIRGHFLAIGIFRQREAASEIAIGSLDAMEFSFLIFLHAFAFSENAEDAICDRQAVDLATAHSVRKFAQELIETILRFHLSKLIPCY